MKNMLYNEDCILGLRKLPEKSVDLILTDPPYGINFVSNNQGGIARKLLGKIMNDEKPFIDFIPEIPRILKNSGGALIFTRWDVQQSFIDALKGCGMTVRSVIIWDKLKHGNGDLDRAFSPSYESIIWACGADFKFPHGRPDNLIRYQGVNSQKLIHPNEKPVGLMEYLIDVTTKRGDTVLDCFMGSGSVAVAARKTGRKFIGFELDGQYFDIAKRRFDGTYEEAPLFAL